MDIKEKELSLLEESLGKIRTKKSKLDSTSGGLFLLSFFIYITSDPSSMIKLALIGFELKNLYAVYILYLMSLLSAISYVMHYIREILLFERYQALLKDVYGSIPTSIPLIFESDYQLRDRIFSGKWSKINSIFHLIVTIPFLIGFMWMSYELITIDSDLKFTKFGGGVVFVFTIQFFIFFLRAIYINWKSE